jgi:hypothetical protein
MATEFLGVIFDEHHATDEKARWAAGIYERCGWRVHVFD